MLSAMIISVIPESFINLFLIVWSLLDNSPQNFIFLKTFNSGFSYIEVWFTEIEDKMEINLVIN